MQLGLQRGTVLLSPHREDWHYLFEQEKSKITNVLGERVIAVEHVGSTAICGIVAKPILDIMVGIASYADGGKYVTALESLDYEYKGENGVPERHFFGKGVPRTHHLHMVAVGSNFWIHHLLFRDYLIVNRHVAEQYNDLKLDLAARFPDNREAYTNGKESFVVSVLQAAKNSQNIEKQS
jgi:GrpB-like predicted nucleotidyltransferase (UPF0157 family)